MATVTAFIRTSKAGNNKLANIRFRLRDGNGILTHSCFEGNCCGFLAEQKAYSIEE